MNSKEIIQYFSVSNGLYYVKRTPEDFFYILTESNEWRYAPSLADEFYDILSGKEWGCLEKRLAFRTKS